MFDSHKRKKSLPSAHGTREARSIWAVGLVAVAPAQSSLYIHMLRQRRYFCVLLFRSISVLCCGAAF